MHRNTAPRRFVREMPLVFLVHLREIIHRRQEHLDLFLSPGHIT